MRKRSETDSHDNRDDYHYKKSKHEHNSSESSHKRSHEDDYSHRDSHHTYHSQDKRPRNSAPNSAPSKDHQSQNGYKIENYLSRDVRARSQYSDSKAETYHKPQESRDEISPYLAKDTRYQEKQAQTATVEKTTEATLKNTLDQLDSWQRTNFKIEESNHPRDPIYTSRIKQQYQQLFKLACDTKVTYLPDPNRDIYVTNVNDHHYAQDQVKIDGLGYLKDPFFVLNKHPRTIQIANEFFARLKEKIRLYNQAHEAKIELTPPAKTDVDKEHSLFKMNVGFKSIVATKDKTQHRFLVIAPSGYGTPQQVKVWELMKEVVTEFNKTTHDCTIIFQTSYNLDRSAKFKKSDVKFNSIFNPDVVTDVNSYFDELIQALLNNISTKHNKYVAPKIEAKACSEKKLEQFTIKLKAYYDTVETYGVENAVLGDTINETYNKKNKEGRAYQSRLPCKQCMKAVPAYHALEQTKFVNAPTNSQPTAPLNEVQLKTKKNQLLDDITRLEKSITQLQTTIKEKEQEEQTPEVLNLITRIKKRCDELNIKKKAHESSYSQLDEQEQSNKAQVQNLQNRYAFLMSPYRDGNQWMSNGKSRELEYDKMMENNIIKHT